MLPGAALPNGVVAGGAEVRAVVGAAHAGASLGVSALSPVTLSLRAGHLEMTRIPIDASVRASFRARRLELVGDLGFVAAVMRLRGPGVSAAGHGDRLDLGIRAALGLRVWLHPRVALFANVHAAGFPRPVELVVAPLGSVGSTPVAWLGGTIGVAVGLH